jgi:hypothetical protein
MISSCCCCVISGKHISSTLFLDDMPISFHRKKTFPQFGPATSRGKGLRLTAIPVAPLPDGGGHILILIER